MAPTGTSQHQTQVCCASCAGVGEARLIIAEGNFPPETSLYAHAQEGLITLEVVGAREMAVLGLEWVVQV